MPNIIFYLNTGAISKDGVAPVMAKIIHNKKRYYKTIARVKATPDIKDTKGNITAKGDWNLGKCRINKNHKNTPYNRHKEINATLNHLDNLTKQFNDYCMLNDMPITEFAINQILSGIDPVSGKKAANRPEISFDEAFKQWLQHTKDNNEHNTHRRRNTVYNFYTDFQKDNEIRISFKNIDMMLFDQVKRYSIETKKHSNNTFAQTIKILKLFLNWCKARNYYTGTLPKDFKANEHDISPITLSVDEFKTLYNYQFDSKKYQKVRDIFCFGCLTGLRYSDLQRVRWDWIYNNQLIKITLQKVKDPVRIPLVDMSLKILDRYRNQPVFALPRVSNQKFNDYLKKACAKAEINSLVTIDTYKGNKFIQETKEKHEVVTAHVARKTFITLSFYLGMNIKVVQDITGIREERTLRKYLKIAEEMKQTEMQETWGAL